MKQYSVRVECCGEAIRDLEICESGEVKIGGEPSVELAGRLKRDLARYFAGEEVNFLDYEVDLAEMPEFSRQVLEETRRIPYGECRSYSDVARLVGRPRAARAVGQALHRNPVAIIIPCHRVVGKDGGLRGFAGGVERKRYLLNLEVGAQ